MCKILYFFSFSSGIYILVVKNNLNSRMKRVAVMSVGTERKIEILKKSNLLKSNILIFKEKCLPITRTVWHYKDKD